MSSSRRGSAAPPYRPADQPKRSHHAFRGVPPPPTFDFDALPDGALLTELETAAVGRWSTNTLAAWRLRRAHGLQWVVIGGGRVRYRVSDVRAYLADATPRTKPPATPVAAPPKRRPRPGTSNTKTEIHAENAVEHRRTSRRPRAAEAAPQETAR